MIQQSKIPMLLANNLTLPDKDTFLAELARIGAGLHINPDLLMLIMHNESGFDPKAVNMQPPAIPGISGYGKIVRPASQPDSPDPAIRCGYRATGLIQFMPATAVYLGTTTPELYRMSATQQLHYVEKYYSPFRGMIAHNDYTGLYLCTFYPAAVGKGDKFLLPDFAYRANTALDMNHDKRISVGEFRAFCKTRIPAEYRNEYC